MTIRARLTLWYSGILLSALLVIGACSFYEMVYEHRNVPGEKGTQANEDGPIEETTEILLYSGLPAMLLALVGGWFLMSRALAPVVRLTRAVEQMRSGHLRIEIPRSGNGDELDRLTQVVNEMSTRVDDSFQRIREFTLHASHELKTPLTVIHGELEITLREERLSAPERERLESLFDEIERLRQIVDGLTFLSKADSGLLKLDIGSVRLDELLRDAYADAQILAEPMGIRLQLDQCDKASVLGDRHRLRQLLLILTDNAVKYNYPKGNITLKLSVEESRVRLECTNTGPGIKPQSLSRVFDPFFRGDESHSKEVDGCGLGLSIARWIVAAHSADIRMNSEVGCFTTVTLLFPVQPSSMKSSEPAEAEVVRTDQKAIAGWGQ